jgi:tol-pal system protein YbgF
MRAIKIIAIIAAPLIAIATGCAGATDADLKKIKQKLDEMAQDQAHNLRRIEELNNRIFLLEDKVDTSRVAMERDQKPQLPVIRLKPGLPEPEEEREGEGGEEVEEGSSPPPGKSVVEENLVAYRGAARKKGPRPVLRLYGQRANNNRGRPNARAQSTPLQPIVGESIPVVPLPKRKVAREMAAGVVPMRDYQTALSMYRKGRFSAAADAFQSFAKKYTQHSYADNAIYWLGECFYDLKRYRLALKIFRRVVEEYPTGNKAPDALLKMAYSYLKLEEKANARTVLAQLMQSFPKSEVARLASKTLMKIQ